MWAVFRVSLVQLLLRVLFAQCPMPTFRVVQSFTYAMYGELPRQVKDMKMLFDDGKNSMLALALAGKSAAIFDLVKDCVKDDLTPQEVK